MIYKLRREAMIFRNKIQSLLSMQIYLLLKTYFLLRYISFLFVLCLKLEAALKLVLVLSVFSEAIHISYLWLTQGFLFLSLNVK